MCVLSIEEGNANPMPPWSSKATKVQSSTIIIWFSAFDPTE